MKKTLRIICFFLAIAFAALTLNSCGGNGSAQTTEPSTTAKTPAGNSKISLKLPYCQNDTLDPFRAKSILNQQIATLLFDSLFTVDSEYKPVCQIAQKADLNSLELTVILKSGLKFSDGSAITAEDVVYSFEYAKDSANYAARLSDIKSAKGSGSTVVFTLSSLNPYEVSNLIFPIVKRGSVSAKIETAKLDETPVGSGRYTLVDNGGSLGLKVNAARLGGYSAKSGSVELINVTDFSAMQYSLEIGAFNFMFDDLSNGSYRRINATTAEVALNNMVYIAFNKSNIVLANTLVRQAINMTIDKDEIASNAFQGYAVKTDTPFNPSWSEVKGLSPDTQSLPKSATQALNDAGYDKINSSGIRYSNGKKMEFTLIVNRDNRFKCDAADIIKDELKNQSISVNVSKLAEKEFIDAVKRGKFDMYIGEMKLTPSMNLNPLLEKGGSVSYGINTSSAASEAYAQFLSETIELNKFIEIFNADLPFIPLCYRKGVAACSRSIRTPLESSAQDVYFSIGTWTF